MRWVTKRRHLFIFLILIFIPTILGGLNYSGMCVIEGRWLSDEERIQLVIHAVSSKDPNFNYLSEKQQDEFTRDKTLRYSNSDEFLKRNPECCKALGPNEGRPIWPSSFEARITGSRAAVVEVKYLARLKNRNGEIVTINQVEYPFISNCGHVFTNFPSNIF